MLFKSIGLELRFKGSGLNKGIILNLFLDRINRIHWIFLLTALQKRAAKPQSPAAKVNILVSFQVINRPYKNLSKYAAFTKKNNFPQNYIRYNNIKMRNGFCAKLRNESFPPQAD
jgi:hypothetical protein